MSEDALSWNVFVSLATAGKLREAADVLTGRSESAETSLYLWGERVDVKHGEHAIYELLARKSGTAYGSIAFGDSAVVKLN